MPHAIRTKIQRAVKYIAVTASLAILAAGLTPVLPHAAADSCGTISGCDSAVVINVSGYPGAIDLYSTNHSFGTCNTPSSLAFSTGGTSRTCVGVQFGYPDGVWLYLNSTPTGYAFNGFTTPSYSTDGSVGCNSYCYMNFQKGSVTVQANFTKNAPATPAAPSAPAPYVSGRTVNALTLSWNAPSTPGGLRQYDIFEGGKVIGTTTAQTFTHSGLACNSTHSYAVRVTDNYGQTATSSGVSSTTTACPVAATSPATNTGSTTTRPATTAAATTSTTAARSTSTSTANSTTSASTTPTPTTTPSSDVASDVSATSETSTDESNTDTVAPKKHFPNWAKILILLGVIGLGLAIWRIVMVRRANAGSNDYWNTPPQY